MKKVISHVQSQESRGSIKNGRVEQLSIYSIWVLTLECGHKEKRRVDGLFSPPAQVKCKICEGERNAA